jgi:hypothetical protein
MVGSMSAYTGSEGLNELRVSLGYFRAANVLIWAEAHGLMFADDSDFSGAPIDIHRLRDSAFPFVESGVAEFGSVSSFVQNEAIWEWEDDGLRSDLIQPIVNATVCRLDSETNSSSPFFLENVTLARAVATAFWDMYEVLQSGNDILNGTQFCHMNSLLEQLPHSFEEILVLVTAAIAKRNDAFEHERLTVLSVVLCLLLLVFLPIVVLPASSYRGRFSSCCW